MRPFKVQIQKMSDTNSEENKNKTPERMARLAWPKAKYGVVLADNNHNFRKFNLLQRYNFFFFKIKIC